MVITIITSSLRVNSTSKSIARKLAMKFNNAEVFEIDLRKNYIPYCKGCLLCVTKGMEYCPHNKTLNNIKEKILKADLLIVATPVYILHMTGQLKTLIDHFSSMFLMHRPEKSMFKKQLVVIATAAGPVYRTTIKEVSECFTYFGIPKIYSMGFVIHSESFEALSEKKKETIENKCNYLSSKIIKTYKNDNFHTPIKSKINFLIYRKVQAKIATKVDREYWNKNGWFKKERPWKK